MRRGAPATPPGIIPLAHPYPSCSRPSPPSGQPALTNLVDTPFTLYPPLRVPGLANPTLAKMPPMKYAIATYSRVSFSPARLDLLQSGSGLILALFMWLHMAFVSSILLGKDAFWSVARFFEGYFIFGQPYPIVVSFIAAGILALVILHAVLALRKFPADWRQYRTFWHHAHRFPHGDTRLWLLQVITGFGLFFLAPVHLYQMLAHPGLIGPFASSDRVWSGHFWPLYLLLLFAVELHAGVGLYRLALKWGWFMGQDPARSRLRMKRGKWILTGLFIGVGLVTLGAYIWIGIQHADQVGERYTPAWAALGAAEITAPPVTPPASSPSATPTAAAPTTPANPAAGGAPRLAALSQPTPTSDTFSSDTHASKTSSPAEARL